MRKIPQRLYHHHTVLLAAGITIGSVATYVVLRNRIILDMNNITLSAPQAVFNWIAENGHVAEFENEAGTFVLHPPL